MDISTRGGELTRADLLKYPVEKNRPDLPVRLFTSESAAVFVARSGLRAADKRAEPTHQATYQSAASEYKLDAGQKELLVPLTWTDGQGVTVTKTYKFKPGSYRIDLSYDVDEHSRAATTKPLPMCSSCVTTNTSSARTSTSRHTRIVVRRSSTARPIAS